jgi:5'-deoxynucleotidase YfbR-like HD superfamily hydrolase
MSNERGNGWIQTHSIGQVWPLDPRPEELRIADIGHAISMLCRFTGHVHSFYSVAEHSVRVSIEAERRATVAGVHDTMRQHIARWGLLHDASEAYLVDLARPVKRLPEMAPYRNAEAAIMLTVAQRFGLMGDEPGLVKEVDVALCYTEARDLFPRVHPEWTWHAEPLPGKIVPLEWREAKALFRARFEELWPEEKWS